MTKEIPLTMGKVALVDDEDYERVMQFKWYACDHKHTFYAKHTVNHHFKLVLHRFIMGVKPDEQVDHINGNGLDCRKCNMRIATQTQNLMNAKKRKNTSSKYKGVCWDNYNKKWEVKTSVNGKRIHLGRFSNEEDAARAYNETVKKHYGDYAKLNQIEAK